MKSIKDIIKISTAIQHIEDLFKNNIRICDPSESVNYTTENILVKIYTAEKQLQFNDVLNCINYSNSYMGKVDKSYNTLCNWINDTYPNWNTCEIYYKTAIGDENENIFASFERFYGLSNAKLTHKLDIEGGEYIHSIKLGDDCNLIEKTIYFNETRE